MTTKPCDFFGGADPAKNYFRKNLLINGGFDVWQRGTSQTISSYGSADRWATGFADATVTFSRQNFVYGQTDVPNNPRFFSRAVVNSTVTAGNVAVITNRIEKADTASGETVTLSFYAKADANRTLTVGMYQYFGVGGSSAVSITPVIVDLTTGWKKYTVNIKLPSVSGLALGTGDALALQFVYSAGTDTPNAGEVQSGTFDIAQVQLEVGSTATDFEYRSYGEELALCQRYYQYRHLKNADAYRSTNVVSGNLLIAQTSYPVTMRVTPTLTHLSGTYQNCNTAVGTTSVNDCMVTVTVPDAAKIYRYHTCYIAVDAEL